MKTLLKRLLPAGIRRQIQKYRLARHLASFHGRIVEHSYLNQRLKVSLRDNLAVGWYDHDWVAMPEVEFLQRNRLKTGATVFDIGAHQGVVAMVLGRIVGESGMVVAVEGTRHNVAVALENCKINGIHNVQVRHAVGADRAGLNLTFSETLNGAVDGGLIPTKVLSVTVDSLASEYRRPDVVFVDVEGYECQVLEGAQHTILAGADFFVEVHAGVGLERHGSVERVLAYFQPTQYDLFWSKGEGAKFQPMQDDVKLPNHKLFIIALLRNDRETAPPNNGLGLSVTS